MNPTVEPQYPPISLLVLQPSPYCNLNCDYCYLPNRSSIKRMPEELVRLSLQRVFDSGLVDSELSLVWHAGEPLMVPIEYYRKANAILDEFAGDCTIIQSIQTNATLINDKWCEYFQETKMKIGVSLDGPAFLHDRHRVDRKGRGSHAGAMRGVALLQKHSIEFDVIVVVSRESLAYPDEIYAFFQEHGMDRIGFNFEETEGIHKQSTLTGLSARTFFERIYALNKAAVKPLNIREFQNAARFLQPGRNLPVLPTFHNDQVRPFGIVSIDADGNISMFSPELLGATSERHPTFTFGNVRTDELVDILKNQDFLHVAQDIVRGLESCAQQCPYFAVCGGGAPANKLFENGSFATTETMYCRNAIQLPMDIVLSDIEKELSLSHPASTPSR